jgi:hypothetical protein
VGKTVVNKVIRAGGIQYSHILQQRDHLYSVKYIDTICLEKIRQMLVAENSPPGIRIFSVNFFRCLDQWILQHRRQP